MVLKRKVFELGGFIYVMKDEKMFKIKDSYQKEIFQRVISKFGSSLKAGQIFKIPASSVRGYKNLYSKTIPESLIDKLISLKILDNKELQGNLLEVKNKSEIIGNSLNLGIKLTQKRFKDFKKEMPSIERIISEQEIDFLIWFDKYKSLLNSGFRKIITEEYALYLKVSYFNFTRGGSKYFQKLLPKKYLLNDDFSYFFGLWCGDRSGGKRFGIINQNKEILDFVKYFLKKNFQNVEKILYCSESSKEPKISYDKKVVIKGTFDGWAISLHSSNGILSSFFYYLLDNIEFLLEKSLNLNAFFAGLFDAEGNVSLYNKSFRWACKDKRLIPIYSKFLKEMNLYEGYDGACLITYNRKDFFSKIFPHMKHGIKVNDSSFLCKGSRENIPNSFKIVLSYIEKYPLSTQKEIAKALKKSKVYSELSLLKEFGFITSENYPLRFKLNKETKNISRRLKL